VLRSIWFHEPILLFVLLTEELSSLLLIPPTFLVQSNCLPTNTNVLPPFLFFLGGGGVLHPVTRTLSRLLEEPSLPTTLQGVHFIFYIFPQHVSALTGHLQVEYTIILGRYFTHNGSSVLCYRSRLLCMFGKYCCCLFNMCLFVVQTWTNHRVVLSSIHLFTYTHPLCS
jgi:hypothetical protein